MIASIHLFSGGQHLCIVSVLPRFYQYVKYKSCYWWEIFLTLLWELLYLLLVIHNSEWKTEILSWCLFLCINHEIKIMIRSNLWFHIAFKHGLFFQWCSYRWLEEGIGLSHCHSRWNRVVFLDLLHHLMLILVLVLNLWLLVIISISKFQVDLHHRCFKIPFICLHLCELTFVEDALFN